MKCKLLAGALLGALGLANVVAVGGAQAMPTTVNIAAYIDNTAETAVTSDFTIDAVNITAHGLLYTEPAGPLDGDPGDVGGAGNTGVSYTWGPYAYLDRGNAGMGVCQVITSSSQCAPASDDNVTGSAGVSEVLSLQIDTAVADIHRIDELYFRNDGHTPGFSDPAAVEISLDGGATFVSYLLETGVTDPSLGATLIGFPPAILVLGQPILMKYVNQQFYLSAFDYTPLGSNLEPVPLPAGLILLLSGLLGLGFLGRYKSKTAAT